MRATKLNDLLPIPDGVEEPHAYQVFGLTGGEQDSGKIKSAVKQVYATLKAAKTETNPILWKQAAKLAESAKAVLTDSAKRAELDGQFGIVDVPTAAAPPSPAGVPPTGMPPAGIPPTGAPPTGMPPTAAPTASPVADPLAGMLPPINPMAMQPPPGIAPGTAPGVAPGIAPVASPGMAPQVAAPQVAVPQVAVPQAAAPKVAGPNVPVFKAKKKTRRRKSGVGKFLFGAFAVVLAAAIGGLGVFLFAGGGQFAVTDDGIVIGKAGDQVERPPQAGAPAELGTKRKKPRDPVMGEMSGGVGLPSTLPDVMSNDKASPMDANAMAPIAIPPGATGTSEMKMGEMKMGEMKTGDTDASAMNPDPTAPVDPSAMLPVTPPVTTGPDEMTDEMVAANVAKLDNVRELLRTAKWNEMVAAADKVRDETLTDEQRKAAEGLYQLAFMADFYRGGIQRGLGTLQATQDFEVTEGFRVLVVEVSDTSITIRFGAKNKTYSLDELPFRLAAKIASFAVPDSPDGTAGKAAYQAIAPLSNAEHRTESISELESIDGELPDVDTRAMANQIKTLFN